MTETKADGAGDDDKRVLKRAAEVFTFEEHASRSRFVETTWRTCSEPEVSFISIAVTHWEMVVTKQSGSTQLTIRGPETKASTSPIPEDAEFFGIQFRLGTFMPGLPMSSLVDHAITLPETTSGSFTFGGATWEFPRPGNADVFVDRLVREGLLAHDQIAIAALEDDATGLSTRSVQRHVSRATGLKPGTIRQIRRSAHAVELLSRGVPALEVVRRTGYSDQAHMTRSVRRFAGQTPSRIAAAAAAE